MCGRWVCVCVDQRIDLGCIPQSSTYFLRQVYLTHLEAYRFDLSIQQVLRILMFAFPVLKFQAHCVYMLPSI